MTRERLRRYLRESPTRAKMAGDEKEGVLVPMSNVWSHEETHPRCIDEPSESITDISPNIRRCDASGIFED